MRKVFLLVILTLLPIVAFSQQQYNEYLDAARRFLNEERIELAEKSYNVWKQMTGNTDLNFEKELKQHAEAENRKKFEKEDQHIIEEDKKHSEASPKNGYINGHEWIDLGLSVKWATCNVGASFPTNYGNYFSWGETRPKKKYVDSSCGSFYDHDLYAHQDAATTNWGAPWRMPTVTEIQELINYWTWATLNGINGFKVTSNKIGYTDKYIFLPAAGLRSVNRTTDVGDFGYYWSSSPYPRRDFSDLAKSLWISFGENVRSKVMENSKEEGLTIRPVTR